MAIPARFLSELKLPLRNAALAGSAVALLSLGLPSQYVSVVRILPAENRGPSGAVQLAAAASALGMALPGQDSSDAAFVDIVNSRWLRKKLLFERYHFRTPGLPFTGLREHEETLYAYLGAKNLDRALLKMNRVLSAGRDLRTKLLSLSVETGSPELSQQVVHRAVKILEEFVQIKAQTRGGNKALFTSERLADAQVRYDQAEQESTAFLNAHRNYATSNEPTVRMRGLRLENTLKLRQEVITTLTLSYEQALLEEKNDMPILNVLDEGDLPIDKQGPPRALMALMPARRCSTGRRRRPGCASDRRAASR